MPTKSNRSGFGRDFGGDVMDMARDRPLATAAVAAAAVGAGVFLWSRRNQISDQLSDLSNQIREWSQSFGSPDDVGGLTETDETTTGSVSGRGRAKSATPQATS